MSRMSNKMENKQAPNPTPVRTLQPTHVIMTPNGLVPVRINGAPTSKRPSQQPVRRNVPFAAPWKRSNSPMDTSMLDDEPLDKLVRPEFSNPRKRARAATDVDKTPREQIDLNLNDVAPVREARPSKIPRLTQQTKAVHQEIDKMMPEFTAKVYKTFLRQQSADGAYQAMRLIIQLHKDLKQIK